MQKIIDLMNNRLLMILVIVLLVSWVAYSLYNSATAETIVNDTKIVREYYLDKKVEKDWQDAYTRNMERKDKYPTIFKTLLN